MTTWKETMAVARAAKTKAEQEVVALQARVKQAVAERDAVEAKVATATEQIQNVRNEALLSILTPEVVDVLAPDHDRTSCADENKRNEDDGCARCALLVALNTRVFGLPWRFVVDPVAR